MAKDNKYLSNVRDVKDILSFLKDEFPSDKVLFFAHYPKERTDELKAWWITMTDGSIYDTEDFKICKEAIRIKYTNFEIYFGWSGMPYLERCKREKDFIIY